MADLTTDINATVGLWSLGDFKPNMPTVRGRVALAHRLCVRLQTPRGRFSFRHPVTGKISGWPNFGTDMAQFLLSKTPPRLIASAAEIECLKDEQVEDAQASAFLEDFGRQLRLPIVITDSNGPFALTMLITQAALTLVELQAT